jgi:hypothetical protein
VITGNVDDNCLKYQEWVIYLERIIGITLMGCVWILLCNFRVGQQLLHQVIPGGGGGGHKIFDFLRCITCGRPHTFRNLA